MNSYKKLPAILMVLMLAGCAAPNRTEVLSSNPSEAGQAPVNYRKSVQKHLQDTLTDPGSIQGLVIGVPKLSKCEETYYADKIYKTMIHGWLVPVQFNAKNTAGGYAGKQNRYYWFQGEKIKRVAAHDPATEYGGTICSQPL